MATIEKWLVNSVENERVKKAKSPEKQETNVGKLFVADNFPTKTTAL